MPPGLDYTLNVYVDWDGDGLYAHPLSRIPKLRGLSINRGASGATDAVAAGTCSFRVVNQERLFNRRNATSSLYGLMLPDRDMYVSLTVAGYPALTIFKGKTATIGATYPVGGLYETSFTCDDAFGWLRRKSIRTAILETVTIDEVIDILLDAADWSASARDLDASAITLARAWWYRSDPLAAINQAAKNSLGGRAFSTRTGDIAFRDYTARALAVSEMTIRGGQSLDDELRREDFIDNVRFKRAGLDVATGLTALYTLNPTGRVIYPGNTHPDNTWHGQYGVAGKSVVTPLAITDWLWTSAQDGSGTDKTAQALVDSFTSYGGGFSITWDCLDSSPMYNQTFQIRGQAIRKSNDERTIEVSAASPVVSGADFTLDFEFNDDSEKIEAYAKWMAAVMNTGQTRVPISRKPLDNAELYTLAALEFESRVTLDIPDADLTGDWFVEKLGLTFPGNNAEPPTFALTLFPSDRVGGNFFRISGAAGAGQDYSAIATAAGSGFDRIAY